MREIAIVVAREYLERVRTRAFILGTLALPVFMVAILLLPQIVDDEGAERTLVLVDEAPAGVGDRFVAELTAPPEEDEEEGNTYVVERAAGPLADVRESLNARVLAEEIDGYVVLPADLLEESEALLRARNITNRTVLRDVRVAASRAAQAARLERAGLQVSEVASLVRTVDVQSARITPEGEEGRDAESTFFFAYIVAFLIYFMTAIYGVNVLRSVLEEKSNRIAEVLVSSIRPRDLMIGKIIGVSSAALTQVAIWAVLIVLLVTQADVLGEGLGITPEVVAALSVDPGTAVLFLLFFIIGFFLFAALFAAVGAAMTTEQEAQSAQMVLMIPLFVPLLFLGAITNDPAGPVATTLGLIPFTAPVAMPMRIASAPIPLPEVLGSLAIMAVTTLVVGWAAGKIYRIGILSTGQKASLRDMVRWLRMA